MKAIIVDDEPLMIKSFLRQSKDIKDFDIVGQFEMPRKALEFAQNNDVDIAFLDIKMPQMSGIELASELRLLDPEILIVFISAYGEHIGTSNQIGADYYIIKPYKKETLESTVERMRLLARRHKRSVRIQTFGRFVVMKDGRPVSLTGKAKEILALLVTRRGEEVSNREIYSILWEGRPYDNNLMKVYYNALKRLRNALEEAELQDLLLSTTNGQMINVAMFDCDYYEWLDGKSSDADFEGEFMSEYSWGEYILAKMVARR